MGDTPRTDRAVVVVGSSMVDLIAYMPRAPRAGETVPGDDFQVGTGGKGANQAVMAARLGTRVVFAGRVGTDAYAPMTRAALAGEGIDLSHLEEVPGPSGLAPIWVEADGTNRIVVIPGANAALDAASARRAVEAFPDAGVVLAQLETPQEATAAAFAAARERGIVTVLNPAPWHPLEAAVLEHCDWLVPNEHEFAELARELGLAADGASDEAVRAAAEKLGKNLVVTRGERDVVLVERGELATVPVGAAEVVDTTGAGDAFVGAFVHGLASGMAPIAAADLASRCATASVTRPGTQSSFPTRDEAARLRAATR